MTSKLTHERRSDCPISVALDLFGDSWSLLIVRDLMFKGLRTFKEFRDAGEGIASNILAERLARLESAGIVVRQPDAADRRRVIYRLTEKGMDLAPALIEIVLWAHQHEATGAPAAQVRAMRTDRKRFIAETRRRWRLGRSLRPTLTDT